MHIPDNLLPPELLAAAHILWLLILGVAVWRLRWEQLRASREQNVFLGAVVALLLLWSLNAGVTPGLGFHFLGVTVFTLMFGWALGIIGVSLASVGVVLNGDSGLQALSLNALVLGVLPVSVSYGIYYLVDRYLPHHVFIYIFLCSFFGAIIAASVAVFAIVGIMAGTNTYSLARIAGEYLPFLPLYLLPEGMLNGILTTAFIGVCPRWLKTFDDESYLQR